MAPKPEMNTPLGEWLRNATPEMRDELVVKSGVASYNYLQLLAGVHRENPKIRLALGIVEAANAIRTKKINEDQNYATRLPYLKVQDLAKPTRRGGHGQRTGTI